MVRGWILVDLASLSILLLRVFMEMATISKWCLVHLWGAEVSTLRYLCLDGLTVSGTRLRRVRDVDMKRDFAFVVCTPILCFSLCHAIWFVSRLCYIIHVLQIWSSLFHCFWSQEFSDPRDAEDAIYNLNNRDVDGSRIIVEFAKGVSYCNFSHGILYMFLRYIFCFFFFFLGGLSY